ncbi:heptaprenylglyceryl phosphate synthase [Zhaonella formicivorans]|uniref:heptaprenylglyceryl phosphate synthase n=1 Tax=Zhaonella formicivorans TaxID=2528593 RepID=UPI0010DD5A92|nr:heptaprenylglyceryl phosphate synthase [Zhaonella formicivorans]
MTNDWKKWRHVTKLDPDKENSLELIELVCSSGTDAILIGGTQGIKRSKVEELLEKVKRIAGHELPVNVEVSAPEAVVAGADKYFIPVVLNTSQVEWLVGSHQEMFLRVGSILNVFPLEELLVAEGYLILNPACAAARKVNAKAELTMEEIISFARVAKFILGLPLIYLEYSGKLGEVQVVAQVKKIAKDTPVFYGGGIRTPEQAKAFAAFADTVVVGNVVYDNPAVLKQIARAVKESREFNQN